MINIVIFEIFHEREGKIMRKYPNINKYFNRTPKGYMLFLLIFHIVSGGLIFIGCCSLPEFFLLIRIVYLVYLIVIAFIIYYLYLRIVNLKNVKVGNHLMKYYGLEGKALERQIDAIDKEMVHPIYADICSNRKYNAFFITENWLVGTDGVNLLRANVCKRQDIIKVDTGVMVRIRKGTSYTYHILVVTDKNNYTYNFWLRSQKNLDMAYDFLRKEQKKVRKYEELL